MSEEFIDIYGNYAIKLLRLQGVLIQCNLNPNWRLFWQCRSSPRAFPGCDCFDRANTVIEGLRLLRQSQQHMSEEFIDIYGNYAIKLLRPQGEMIQTFDRYRRGNKQTVEVRHVHIHSGGQGVVGIINDGQE